MWDIDGAGDRLDPGLRHRHQRQRGRDGRLQGRDRRAERTASTSTARLLRRRRRPQDRDGHAVGGAAADPAGLPHRQRDRPGRLRQLGASRRRGPCRRRPSRASTSPSWSATDDRRRQPHHLRRPRRRQPLRRAVPDLRHDLAGLQHATAATASTSGSRRPAAPTRSATTGRSPPAATTRPTTSSSTPSTRWSAGSKPTATTSATSTGVDTDRRGAAASATTRCSCRSATTSTGRARSAPTSRPRATPASTSRSSAATRSSGRRAGRPSIDGTRHAVPHAGHLQGDARQRQDRSRPPDVDRHLARPALQPAGRRRPARERADRHDLHGQLRRPTAITVPAARRQAAVLAQHRASPTLAAGADGDARRRHARLRVGRGPRQRLRGPPGLIRLSTTTGDASPQYLQDYGSDRTAPAPRRTPDAVPRAERRARLRRRHRPVVVGPRRQPRRAAGAAGRPAHAAGDGQPVRRHGRAAGDAASRPGRGHASRPTPPRPTVDDHRARRPARASADGTAVTITGTATDTGGGVVGGVEVSIDGGATLAPGHGHERRGATPGRPDGRRAPPRSARGPSTTAATSAPPASSVTVTVGGRTCPCSIWPATPCRPTPNETDIERGRARRRSSAPTRPARSPASASTRAPATPARTSAPVDQHRHAAGDGDLHRRDGERLAAGDLRHARCRSPANTTYVASYYARTATTPTTPATSAARASTAPPLHALAERRRRPNGVYGDARQRFPTDIRRRQQLLGRRRLHVR